MSEREEDLALLSQAVVARARKPKQFKICCVLFVACTFAMVIVAQVQSLLEFDETTAVLAPCLMFLFSMIMLHNFYLSIFALGPLSREVRRLRAEIEDLQARVAAGQ